MNNREQDLDWLAFCYAAGELDATQSAAFEELLATSQDARERLAAVVALTQGVADACTAQPGVVHPAAIRPRNGRRHRTGKRLLWLTSGLAALVFAFWVGSNPPSDKSLVSTSQAQLASAWAESLDDPSSDPEITNEPAATELLSDEVETAESAAVVTTSDNASEVDDGVEVPDWMIAALGVEEASDPANDEADMGEDRMLDELLDEWMFQEG